MTIYLRQVPGAEPFALVRYDGGALTVNGLPADPSAVIEYGESCATVSDAPSVRFVIEALPSAPEPAPEPVAYVPPPPDSCTRFQGLRALGRVRVEQIEAVMAQLDTLEVYPGVTLSPDEVWAIRTAWREAGTFERLSPDLAFVMWLFGWGDDMRDDFFRWIGEGNIAVFPDK